MHLWPSVHVRLLWLAEKNLLDPKATRQYCRIFTFFTCFTHLPILGNLEIPSQTNEEILRRSEVKATFPTSKPPFCFKQPCDQSSRFQTLSITQERAVTWIQKRRRVSLQLPWQSHQKLYISRSYSGLSLIKAHFCDVLSHCDKSLIPSWLQRVQHQIGFFNPASRHYVYFHPATRQTYVGPSLWVYATAASILRAVHQSFPVVPIPVNSGKSSRGGDK